MIPVCQPTIDTHDRAAVFHVMKSNWLSTGSVVLDFESELSKSTGYPYVMAVSSCTMALFLALKAHGVGPGSVVGVPALTFTATAAVVEHTGATVKFLDIEGNWLLGFQNVRLDAVIPVDLYGQLVPKQVVQRWRQTDVSVVEDGAHAIGADLSHQSDTVCLSFYVTKNITTLGEGGAVLTRNKRVAEYVRRMRQHGLSDNAWDRVLGKCGCEVIAAGYKANMTDVQAAMGLSQLENLPNFVRRREVLASIYDSELKAFPRPVRQSGGVVHLYPVRLPSEVDRNKLIVMMREKGVGLGVHYNALTKEPYWRNHGIRAACPRAECIGNSVVSLPLYPHLTAEDQQKVIKDFKESVECLFQQSV